MVADVVGGASDEPTSFPEVAASRTTAPHLLSSDVVRDSLQAIGEEGVTYIARKSLPDKSELGRSTETERTATTIGSDSEICDPVTDIADEVDVAEEEEEEEEKKAPGRAQDASNRNHIPHHPPTKPKSILKHKTVEESLKVEYQSSRRKQLRRKREEKQLRRKREDLRKKRSMRHNMTKTLSRMSKRSLFESDVDGADDSVRKNVRNPRASSEADAFGSFGGRQLSKSHSHVGTVTIAEPPDGVVRTPGPEISTSDRRATFTKAKSLPVHDVPNDATDQPDPSRSRTNSKRTLFSKSKSKSKTFSSGSLSSLFFIGSRSAFESGAGDDNEANEDKTTAISWDWIEVREYDPEIDANPCVSRGPGVSLSWKYVVTDRVKFEEYENLRPPRREMNEMRLPAKEREERLLASGVTQKEIQAAIENINEARKKRMKTVQQLEKTSMHERIEGAKKKFLRLIGKRKSHKKEEKDLWENAQCYFAASV